jgi:hypothetical protein
MKNIILIAAVVALGWYGNRLYEQHGLAFLQNGVTDSVYTEGVKCITKDGTIIYGSVPHGTVCERMERIDGSLTVVTGDNSSRKTEAWYSTFLDGKENNTASNFKCDGRTYCSQMRSCEEATFFLRNCPNVKMDGDNDGIPCEQQWCGR